MNRLRSLLAILALIATVAGCAKMPPTHYYTLGPRTSSDTGATGSAATDTEGWSVGVRSFQVDAPFDQDRIVYRIGDGSSEVGFYAYHRWAAPPASMLPVLVARAMHGAAGIRRIEPVMAGRTYTAYLDGRVLSLEEVDRADGQLVRARLALWLTAADGSEVWSGTVEAEGATQTSEVAIVVDRMADVLAEALAQAREDLAAHLAP